MVSTAIDADTSSTARRQAEWVIGCGTRYWPAGLDQHLRALPQPEVSWKPSRRCQMVPLPAWAADIGIGTPPALLVDSAALADGDGDPFERCNWLAAAYMFLTGAQESGSSESSYSGQAGVADTRLFERAWVNRHLLLLRRLAARQHGQPEDRLFGPRPDSRIDLTHDVDAVSKTLEIRLKQTAFLGFNAARAAVQRDWPRAGRQAGRCIRFLASTPSYAMIEPMRAMEEAAGVRSTFHVYGGPPGLQRRSPARMLLDPGYDAGAVELRAVWRKLLAGGWQIGVHPSFHSSQDADTLSRETAAVARACGQPVSRCRQHWLRFAWTDTWRAQAAAGLELDTTLGFNDRPGFRNGAALAFRPWDVTTGHPLPITALPMVFMDSHFYDYLPLPDDQRRAAISSWIDEVRAVGGEASVNWHPHTLSADYGWEPGFRALLQLIA